MSALPNFADVRQIDLLRRAIERAALKPPSPTSESLAEYLSQAIEVWNLGAELIEMVIWCGFFPQSASALRRRLVRVSESSF